MKKLMIAAVAASSFCCVATIVESGQLEGTTEYYKLAGAKENNNKRFAVSGYTNISSDIQYMLGGLGGANYHQLSFMKSLGAKAR